jgi:hypothetical protein
MSDRPENQMRKISPETFERTGSPVRSIRLVMPHQVETPAHAAALSAVKSAVAPRNPFNGHANSSSVASPMCRRNTGRVRKRWVRHNDQLTYSRPTTNDEHEH